MRVGIETILWGSRIEELDEVLGLVAGLGFQGVEFAQSPDCLPDVQTLLEQLARHELQLVGLAGGTLADRVAYCRGHRPGYLYVDTWDEKAAVAAMEAGFTLALHPHVFMDVSRLERAVGLLRAHRSFTEAGRLKLLPDTAHLWIAGDDPVAAVRQHRPQLAAVHLKDWTPLYGRSYHRYARGFVELGRGEVRPERVVAELRAAGGCPWLVAELDSTSQGRRASAHDLATWLAGQGLLPPPRLRRPKPSFPGLQPYPEKSSLADPDGVGLAVIWGLFRLAYLPREEFYGQAANLFAEAFKADLVTIASCNLSYKYMALLGAYPPRPETARRTIRLDESVSGPAIASLEVREHELPSEELTRRSPLREEMTAYRRLVSVPVLNTWNPHHVRLMVNLFFKDPAQAPRRPVVERVAREFGIAADVMLDSQCVTAGVELATLAEPCPSVEDFLAALRDLVCRLLRCNVISLFLVNEAADRLEAAAGSAVDWHGAPAEEQFYRRGEGLTGRAWHHNQAVLTPEPHTEEGWKGKSADIARGRGRPDYYLIAPVRTYKNRVVGVIRCGRDSAGGAAMFTDDDLAVIDALSQIAVPYLEVLRNRETTMEYNARLVHELANPVTAIRGAARLMQVEAQEGGHKPEKMFSQDYLGDIVSWAELMKRLLRNPELVSAAALPGSQLQQESTLLLKDVILPAVRQSEALLRERGFSPRQVLCGDFQEIPALFIDRNLFQQVFFNLLTNSIKYAYSDADLFIVEVVGREAEEEYRIHFRDWGPGIPEGMEEKVFEVGFRDPAAAAKAVGQGLGLPVARRAVEAHGGTIEVTNNRYPTEFTIRLPRDRVRSMRGARRRYL